MQKHPNKAQELLQYMAIIRDASARHGSLLFRNNDEQFRLRQAIELQPWGKLNPDLWLRIMSSSYYTFNSKLVLPSQVIGIGIAISGKRRLF